MKSRKLIGMILGLSILTLGITVLAIFTTDILNSAVIICYMVLVVFLIVAYIGGNVFNAFIKSKYFRAELNE